MRANTLRTFTSFRSFAAATISATCLLLSLFPSASSAQSATTAWANGSFNVDIPNIVRRSNIILGQANPNAPDSMPLGNGSLGAAIWAANGFTAQLNRDDTFPDRKSPGWVVIPGLSAMTSAANFTAHLDLYDGVLTESGGGITATIYVRATTDELVIDVTGANPASTQTVQASLWSGRSPSAAASGVIGSLAETWTDNEPDGTGATFGTLLAITAGGSNVMASVVNSLSVQLQFTPNADGSFRVVVGAPTWTGGNANTTASNLFGTDATVASATLESSHLTWWHNFWTAANPLKMSSTDGSAQYFENLRAIYLYQEASLNRGIYPGTHAGIADLFSYTQDVQDWSPSDYWFWNLRMMVAANISSGVSSLNIPFINLYTSNLSNIEAWTSTNVPGSSGACVPETMRYNGNGYGSPGSCITTASPSYNAQTFTSGAEASLWIWNQYLATNNSSLLQSGYPLMKASAQFLLSQARLGADGYLHTTANAHESQWDVTDPVTDIVAMTALFPAVVSAAQKLGTDQSFVSQLQTAETQIPPLPRTDAATHSQLLTASSDSGGQDVIAFSTQPTAPFHNVENLDLEALWPYNVIGDQSPLSALANRTYFSRLNINLADWSVDSIEAARLGLPSQVQAQLLANVERYQVYTDGFATYNGNPSDQPYNEETGMVATALNEALVQDYDGTLRVATGWPSGWTGQGSVSIQNNGKVDVEYENGVLVTVVLEAGATASQNVRSPWPGQSVQVIDGASGATAVAATTAATFSIPMTTGHKYLVEQSSSPFTSLGYAEITGSPATSDKHLGPVHIGLDYASLANAFNDVGTTADSNTNPGNLDGGGESFSENALAAVGASAGATVTFGGVSFTWPRTAGTGTPDNVVASGQTVAVNSSGSTLGFLLAGTFGSVAGTGTVLYNDGTTQSFTLTAPDWWGSSSGTVAFNSAYQNRPGNTTSAQSGYVYFVGIALNPSKTVMSVQLPNVSTATVEGSPAMHIFAMGIESNQYASLAAAFNNVGLTSDTNTNPGNLDGSGSSYSENALTAAGAAPGQGGSSGGVPFNWPSTAGSGSPDNVVASGQTITMSGSGSTLGFLVAGTFGTATGTGTITYTDGSTQTYTLSGPDWWGSSSGTVAITSAYQNRQGNTTSSQPGYVYLVGIPLTASKTLSSVQLPNVSAQAIAGAPALHVFAIGVH